jgi:DNA-binding CsgD family transcriptional regulator
MRKQVRIGLQHNVDAVRLTEREQEVLRLVVTGMTYREIAAALTVTGHTAREYIARLYLKLGVTRRSACVARAFELGLVGKTVAKE